MAVTPCRPKWKSTMTDRQRFNNQMHYIGSSIKTPADWQQVKKEHLSPDNPARKPDIAQLKKDLDGVLPHVKFDYASGWEDICFKNGPLVERGGYIPFCDHRCPPDVSWENYLFYLDLKEKTFGMKQARP